MTGPNPIEKRSTPTPNSRATRKWPNSWTRINTPSTTTKDTSVVTIAPPASPGRRAGQRGVGQPSADERSRLGIHVDTCLDAVEPPQRDAIEGLRDQLGNAGEGDLAGQERRHCHLVRRI